MLCCLLINIYGELSCVLSLLHKVMVLHNREYLDLNGVCRFGMLACQVCV